MYLTDKSTGVPIDELYLYIPAFSLWGSGKDCPGNLWACQDSYVGVWYSPYRDELQVSTIILQQFYQQKLLSS